ncbi:hypothetical protein PybrP1_005538 [[Pythium] brassicae (nom. inval.)]|nr:hypothetical protein PybrP1_005538 [[Pythium] brassicae (nom. inval.)]
MLAPATLLLLAAPPLGGLALGLPVGFLKERLPKHSLRRWALALAPLLLAPLLPLQQAAALLAGLFVGRAVGASVVGVGLTGGIGTGKSTVSKRLQEAGAVIVDADVIARQVVMPGQGAYKAIVRAFGADVLHPDDKTLNRAKLGAIIFSDPAKRKVLNACTHKFIIWEMVKQLVYNRLVRRKRLVVLDAPLLFETALLEHVCYPTIVVACSEENELVRLEKRDGLSREDAEKRIRSQMPLHEKVRRADVVIQNDGTLDELLQSARQTLQRAAELVGATSELKAMLMSRLQGIGRRPPPLNAIWRLPRLAGASAASSPQSLQFHSLRSDNDPRIVGYGPRASGHHSHVPPSVLLLLLPRGHPMHAGTQLRAFASRRGPWQQNDWVDTAKTGGLVLLGVGALVASTSLAFGLIITGAAGYGVYTLYQKVFGPYRSRHRDDPFSSVSANVDKLSEMFGRKPRSTGSAAASSSSDMGSRELDALVQGMPLVVRGLVKTIFSFVGGAMKSSMQRAGELRRLTNERVQAHPRVVEQLGSGVSVSTPQQWMESTVNGVGAIEAVFPVNSSVPARVTVKASVGQGGGVSLQELKLRNLRTGEVIDLLRDGSAGPRKTVIDADYVEL